MTGELKGGGPLGPVYCVFVFALVVVRARGILDRIRIVFGDVWCMDDGQILCEVLHVKDIIRAIDVEARAVGVARGWGTEVKSVCRIIGLASRRSEAAARWLTTYLQESSTPRNDSDVDGHVLGIDFDVDAGFPVHLS